MISLHASCSRLSRFLLAFLFTVSLVVMSIPVEASAASDPGSNNPPNLRQFTSAGHILGFSTGEWRLVSESQMLNTEFVGANPVVPQSADSALKDPAAPAAPLTSVTYTDLWDGVSVVYSASPGALVKSAYYIDADNIEKSVQAIHLRYNRPVSLDEGGNLVLAFDSGVLTEAAPIAWQVIDSEKIAAPVSFRLLSDHEIGFTVTNLRPGFPLVIDPVLKADTWNTFLGDIGNDQGYAIAVDALGNTYVTGLSSASWGSPLRAYSGANDIFVAKLSLRGDLLWNTFLGGIRGESGPAIALDSAGNVYISGSGDSDWGSPKRALSGFLDAFVSKLDTDGSLVWNTFLGGSGDDFGVGLALDSSRHVLAAGSSNRSWGDPLHSFNANIDVSLACLEPDGTLSWNTFAGGGGDEQSKGIALDAAGNIYLAGGCTTTWGSPLFPLAGGSDVFAVKFSPAGSLLWSTFLGCANSDYCSGIAADSSGNVFLTGASYGASWGDPLRAPSGNDDIFIAKLNTDGARVWNTFLGSATYDIGGGIALDAGANIYVSGTSGLTWGAPQLPFTSGSEVFAAKLDKDGALLWNTFLGCDETDSSGKIGVSPGGSVSVTGFSQKTWGNPIRAFTPYTYIEYDMRNHPTTYTNPDALVVRLSREGDFTPSAPEISLEGNAALIPDNSTTPSLDDHTDFGSADVAAGTVVRTFTIRNSGNQSLTLTGDPRVALSGPDSAYFSVSQEPASSIAAADNTTFQVTFDPDYARTYTAAVSIDCDDADENPYNFAIAGQGSSLLTLDSRFPAANQLGVDVTSDIDLMFNTPIDNSTCGVENFTVNGSLSGLINGYGECDGPELVFNPSADFKPGEIITITLTTRILSNVGGALALPLTWQFTVAAESGQSAFSGGPDFGPGTDNTTALALGDIDGDGDLDIVAGNYGQPNQVYLNNGDGSDFTPFVFGTGADNTTALALGDLDGDGDLDIAAGNQFETNVIYFNVLGGLLWTPLTLAEVADNTTALASGDVDGDGDLDIVVGNYGESNLVYFNNGDGSVWTPLAFGPGAGNTTALALGDVDGDGDLDIVVGNDLQPNIVYLNNGNGTVWTPRDFGPGDDATQDLALGDLDGDGDLDIAVVNAGAQNAVYLNDGSGAVWSPVCFGDDPALLAVGDIDQDGDLDIITGLFGGQNIIYKNDGSGAHWTPQNFGPGAGLTTSIVVGDVNGDGRLDITVGCACEPNIVYLNLGSEISVFGRSILIPDGDLEPETRDDTDFGFALVDDQSIDHTFTLYNTGDGSLTLTGSPRVVLEGEGASAFSVVSQPDSPLGVGDNTTFTLRLNPDQPGRYTALVSISSDSGPDPYQFAVQGFGGTVTSVGGDVEPVNRLALLKPFFWPGLLVLLTGLLWICLHHRKYPSEQ